jgi:very-short-patch-repair endonuclease
MPPRHRIGQGWSTKPALWAKLKGLVREARHEPTPAENLLWQKLRRRALGVQFRRQHPLSIFYVDFYCPKFGLVVELDGPIHGTQAERDAVRTEMLETLGYTVIRFTNLELFRNPSAVVAQITDAVNSVSPRHAS